MNTNRARVLLQPSYVLHRRAFRDSSLLVELFTPKYGRVGLIARAARQSSSRLQGVVQPFRSLLVSWSGNGELPTLSAAEAEGGAWWLTGQALMGGFYVNELLVRLLHRFDPHPNLYAVYHNTVQALAEILNVRLALVFGEHQAGIDRFHKRATGGDDPWFLPYMQEIDTGGVFDGDAACRSHHFARRL